MGRKVFLFVIFLTVSATAQIPQQINFQGYLADAANNSVTGTNSITFGIYNDETSSQPLWSESQSVEVKNGLFSVLLGSVNPIPLTLFYGATRFLAIKIGTDPEMMPRQKISSTAYAFNSGNALALNGHTASQFAGAEHDHNSDYPTKTGLSGNDGIPNQIDDLVSWSKLKDIPSCFADGTDEVGSATGGITQISGGTGLTIANPTGPTAAINLNMGHSHGIDADMLDGTHLSSLALSDHNHLETHYTKSELNQNTGTVNQTDNPVSWSKLKNLPDDFADGIDNVGSGISEITGSAGLTITNPNGPNTAISINTTELTGLDADKLDGKNADAFSSAGHKHSGEDWVAEGNTHGLYIYNPIGRAFSGQSSSNYGFYGISATAAGVYGTALNGIGVQGYGGQAGMSACGGNFGISAYSTSGGIAGHFQGDVEVTGNLSKGGGTFKIDHPLDPANKFLQHSFVESPDMMNIYNGNIILNSNGEAEIILPEWFESLNKDFRYQLTCIGGFAQVYIAQKVANNRFRIAGGFSGLEISWQVTGIRKDAYANAHRVEVEVEKTGKERGRYIHPELFGMPEESRINYEMLQSMLKNPDQTQEEKR